MPNEMVETPRFIPTAENTYVISYPSHGSDYPYDFAAILAQSVAASARAMSSGRAICGTTGLRS